MPKKLKIVLWTAVISFGVFLACLVGLIYFFATNSPTFHVTVEQPPPAKVGDEIAVKISIQSIVDYTNRIASIDIYNSVFEGVEYISCDPIPSKTGRRMNAHEFIFDQTLQPGMTEVFDFRFKAVRSGTFSAEVSAFNDSYRYGDSSILILIE